MKVCSEMVSEIFGVEFDEPKEIFYVDFENENKFHMIMDIRNASVHQVKFGSYSFRYVVSEDRESTEFSLLMRILNQYFKEEEVRKHVTVTERSQFMLSEKPVKKTCANCINRAERKYDTTPACELGCWYVWVSMPNIFMPTFAPNVICKYHREDPRWGGLHAKMGDNHIKFEESEESE